MYTSEILNDDLSCLLSQIMGIKNKHESRNPEFDVNCKTLKKLKNPKLFCESNDTATEFLWTLNLMSKSPPSTRNQNVINLIL